MNNVTDKNGMIWFDRYAFPSYWGFCPNEKVWAKQMKELGRGQDPYPEFETDTDALVSEFMSYNHHHFIIVTLGDFKGQDPINTVSAIAHEIEHVWQKIKAHIGEDKPGNETEAYVKQDMIASMLHAYEEHRHRLFK